jgi:hypothetical protein
MSMPHWEKGDKIRHTVFGIGTITDIRNYTLFVSFADGESKTCAATDAKISLLKRKSVDSVEAAKEPQPGFAAGFDFGYCCTLALLRQSSCKQLLDFPNVIGQSGFHCRGYSQRLVDSDEVVPREVQGHHWVQHLPLFAESIGQAGESPHLHPHGEVRPKGRFLRNDSSA